MKEIPWEFLQSSEGTSLGHYLYPIMENSIEIPILKWKMTINEELLTTGFLFWIQVTRNGHILFIAGSSLFSSAASSLASKVSFSWYNDSDCSASSVASLISLSSL